MTAIKKRVLDSFHLDLGRVVTRVVQLSSQIGSHHFECARNDVVEWVCYYLQYNLFYRHHHRLRGGVTSSTRGEGSFHYHSLTAQSNPNT